MQWLPIGPYKTKPAIANFDWGTADDVLRELYVQGKYRNVNLPLTVTRRLDSTLEPRTSIVQDVRPS